MFFHWILDGFFTDFSCILGAVSAPFRLKNRPKRGGRERDHRSLKAIARRRLPGVPPDPQNGPPRTPIYPKISPNGTQASPKAPWKTPKSAQNHPKITPKTKLVGKNVNFCKRAPRLHKTLLFENPGSQQPYKNPPKTIPKTVKNLIISFIHFLWIFYRFHPLHPP